MPPGQRPFTPIAEDAKKRLAEAIGASLRPTAQAAVARMVRPRSGIGSAIGSATKTLGGVAISPLVTAADVVAAPIEKVTGTTLVDPKSVGSFNLLSEAWRGAQQASNRAAGDIAAIPGVGQPSASPTAADIRRYGVLEGVGRATVDYGNLASMVYPVARAGALLRTARAAEAAATNPYINKANNSSVEGLAEIQARQAIQEQYRQRAVPTNNRVTVEPRVDGRFVTLRTFNNETGEYNGVMTLVRADDQYVVTGMSSTSPIAAVQLSAAADAFVRSASPNLRYSLIPSESLSVHSFPFVTRLQEAGLIDPKFKPSQHLNALTRERDTPDIFAPALRPDIPQSIMEPTAYQDSYNKLLRSLVESRKRR